MYTSSKTAIEGAIFRDAFTPAAVLDKILQMLSTTLTQTTSLTWRWRQSVFEW